jgi:hypothetical protein
MNSIKVKVSFIVVAFLLGFSAASFQSSRFQLEDEISDYQREILIASRLLEEYTENCAIHKQGNFSPYVEHATSAYEKLLKKSEKFPYFMGNNFINDHEESIFNFKEKIELSNKKMGACSET